MKFSLGAAEQHGAKHDPLFDVTTQLVAGQDVLAVPQPIQIDLTRVCIRQAELPTSVAEEIPTQVGNCVELAQRWHEVGVRLTGLDALVKTNGVYVTSQISRRREAATSHIDDWSRLLTDFTEACWFVDMAAVAVARRIDKARETIQDMKSQRAQLEAENSGLQQQKAALASEFAGISDTFTQLCTEQAKLRGGGTASEQVTLSHNSQAEQPPESTNEPADSKMVDELLLLISNAAPATPSTADTSEDQPQAIETQKSELARRTGDINSRCTTIDEQLAVNRTKIERCIDTAAQAEQILARMQRMLSGSQVSKDKDALSHAQETQKADVPSLVDVRGRLLTAFQDIVRGLAEAPGTVHQKDGEFRSVQEFTGTELDLRQCQKTIRTIMDQFGTRPSRTDTGQHEGPSACDRTLGFETSRYIGDIYQQNADAQQTLVGNMSALQCLTMFCDPPSEGQSMHEVTAATLQTLLEKQKAGISDYFQTVLDGFTKVQTSIQDRLRVFRDTAIEQTHSLTQLGDSLYVTLQERKENSLLCTQMQAAIDTLVTARANLEGEDQRLTTAVTDTQAALETLRAQRLALEKQAAAEAKRRHESRSAAIAELESPHMTAESAWAIVAMYGLTDYCNLDHTAQPFVSTQTPYFLSDKQAVADYTTRIPRRRGEQEMFLERLESDEAENDIALQQNTVQELHTTTQLEELQKGATALADSLSDLEGAYQQHEGLFTLNFVAVDRTEAEYTLWWQDFLTQYNLPNPEHLEVPTTAKQLIRTVLAPGGQHADSGQGIGTVDLRPAKLVSAVRRFFIGSAGTTE